MGKSNIEWTDETWNPVAGCSKVSPGCKHCYAEVMTKRLAAMGQEKYQGLLDDNGRWNGQITVDYDALQIPLKWKKPRMVFVNSMSDLFHEGVKWSFIQGVFETMRETPQHTYQILTKRPERMRDYFEHREPAGTPPNVWIGASVENQEQADKRIPILLDCPALIRFLSCEPLLGEVDLSRIELVPDTIKHGELERCGIRRNVLSGQYFESQIVDPNNKIDWVICGGESGGKARPMHPDWARGLRDQCVAAGVPFFFKQWGEWAPGECAEDAPTRTERTARWWDDKWIFEAISVKASEEMHCDDAPDLYRLGKASAGRMLDGVIHNEFPKVAV